MEVQGAYFRGCYVALIGIVRVPIHLTDAPSASTCFTKAGNYLQIFIHIFIFGRGYLLKFQEVAIPERLLVMHP